MTTYPEDSTKNHPDNSSYYEVDDNGTMPENVALLRNNVIGRRIVKAETAKFNPNDFKNADEGGYWDTYRTYDEGFILTLDDGRRVVLRDSHDCCAHTYLDDFLLHADKIDHAITNVATENGYTKWHIFCDLGDILSLDVSWSAGNAFYYGYGFEIGVSNTIEGEVIANQLGAPTRQIQEEPR